MLAPGGAKTCSGLGAGHHVFPHFRFSISAPEPPVDVIADHPFMVLIQDVETGAILFVGRVMNPAA